MDMKIYSGVVEDSMSDELYTQHFLQKVFPVLKSNDVQTHRDSLFYGRLVSVHSTRLQVSPGSDMVLLWP